MKIAITTDHTGLAYDGVYDEIKAYIAGLGHELVDYGPRELNMDDDYPELITPAAQAVANGECEVGIVMGGSGQGEAMAANRVKGVRCTLFYGPVFAKQPVDAEGNESANPYEILRLSRQHNHANMLSLSSRFLSLDEMKTAISVWLETPHSDEERHVRRVGQLG